MAIGGWNLGGRVPIGRRGDEPRLHDRAFEVGVAAHQERRRRGFVAAGTGVKVAASFTSHTLTSASMTSSLRPREAVSPGDDLGFGSDSAFLSSPAIRSRALFFLSASSAGHDRSMSRLAISGPSLLPRSCHPPIAPLRAWRGELHRRELLVRVLPRSARRRLVFLIIRFTRFAASFAWIPCRAPPLACGPTDSWSRLSRRGPPGCNSPDAESISKVGLTRAHVDVPEHAVRWWHRSSRYSYRRPGCLLPTAP